MKKQKIEKLDTNGDNLLNKIDQSNTITYIIGGCLLLIIIGSLFKYYKNRQDSKYRELAIIMVVGIFY